MCACQKHLCVRVCACFRARWPPNRLCSIKADSRSNKHETDAYDLDTRHPAAARIMCFARKFTHKHVVVSERASQRCGEFHRFLLFYPHTHTLISTCEMCLISSCSCSDSVKNACLIFCTEMCVRLSGSGKQTTHCFFLGESACSEIVHWPNNYAPPSRPSPISVCTLSRN